MWKSSSVSLMSFALLSSVLLSAFFFTSATFATTSFDNKIQQISDLNISNNCSGSSPTNVTCSSTINVTTDWLTRLQNIAGTAADKNSMAQEFLTKYNNADPAVGWTVGLIDLNNWSIPNPPSNHFSTGFFACAFTKSVTWTMEHQTTDNYDRLVPSSSSGKKCVLYYNNPYTHSFETIALSTSLYFFFSPDRIPFFTDQNTTNRYSLNPRFLFFNGTINYPSGYSGTQLSSATLILQKQKPIYTFSVSALGELHIQYEKNISPFLTGITTTALDKMTNKWGGLDNSSGPSTIWTEQATPAGWLDQTTTISNAGYYMLHFSHNQQLDNPPWSSPFPRVEDAWVQFYWDGHSVVNGTTDCQNQSICNPTLAQEQGPFGSVLNTYGLTAAVNAPLLAIQSLSTKTCSNIAIPFVTTTISVPCLSTFYSSGALATVIPIYQLAITGLLAYWLSIKTLGHIKKLSDPVDDSIDVVDL